LFQGLEEIEEGESLEDLLAGGAYVLINERSLEDCKAPTAVVTKFRFLSTHSLPITPTQLPDGLHRRYFDPFTAPRTKEPFVQEFLV
jgi:hypothetical protein